MRQKITIALVFLLMGPGVFSQDLNFQWLRGFQRVDARKEIRIPDIMGYKTLKGDFHMHTIFSDGVVLPSERVHEAWREGLDVIAITDHTTPQPRYVKGDYNTSWKMAVDVAKRRGITLIQATEYTKSEPVGHINLLFIKDANPFRGDSLSPHQAMVLANRMGAFVIYNHPGWPDKNSELDTFHVNHLQAGRIHGMEIINGDELYPVVMDYVHRYNLAPFSNTDIHGPIHSRYELNRTHRNLTLIFAKSQDEADVKEAMFKGRTVAYADNLLSGRKEYIFELLKASLEISRLEISEFDFSCDVTNHSDITWYLDGPGHTYYTFPANRTVQVRESLANSKTRFKVVNTLVGPDEQLEVPLNFLLAAPGETMMPYPVQNLVNLPPGTPVKLEVATPGAEIRYTLDGTDPNENSTLYAGPFVPQNSAVLKARAFKTGMKPGLVLREQILVDQLHAPVMISGKEKGLNYQYMEGGFASVWEMKRKGKPVKSGTVAIPELTMAEVPDYFGVIFDGYLYAPKDGAYEFTIESDDGAVLKIAGVELVDNDGSHSLKKAKGTIKLKKGYHPVELLYFDDYDEQELRLFWTVPGGEPKLIGPESFFLK
jgi:hypothetical protein